MSDNNNDQSKRYKVPIGIALDDHTLLIKGEIKNVFPQKRSGRIRRFIRRLFRRKPSIWLSDTDGQIGW